MWGWYPLTMRKKKEDIEKLRNSYTVNKYNFISLTDLELCPSKQYIAASRQDVTPFYGLYSSFLPQNSLIHSFIYSYIFFFNSSLKHRSVERISNSHPSIFCQPKKRMELLRVLKIEIRCMSILDLRRKKKKPSFLSSSTRDNVFRASSYQPFVTNNLRFIAKKPHCWYSKFSQMLFSESNSSQKFK